MSFRRHWFSGLFAIIGLGCLLLAGCTADNPIGPGVDLGRLLTNPTSPGGTASVRMSVKVSPDRDDVLPTIRATASGGSVLFRLTLFDAANATTTYLEQMVPIAADGAAEAVFENVPTLPVVAQVAINGGAIAGFKDFLGALDLTAGENRIQCSPAGTNQVSEIVANALLAAAADPELVRRLPTGAVARVREVVQTVNPAETGAREEVFNRVLAQFAPPDVLVRLAISSESRELVGVASAGVIWRKSVAELFDGVTLFGQSVNALIVDRVLRHPIDDADGFVIFRHALSFPAVIARVRRDGTRGFMLRHPGPIFAVIVLPNGHLIVGGFHGERRCPVISCWNPAADGTGTSDSGAHDLVWERIFTELAATDADPNPGVLNVTFDGRGMLICAVRDPGNRVDRVVRLQAHDGMPFAEPPAIPLPLPIPEVTIASPAVGTLFDAGTSFDVIASAAIASGSIQEVRFFAGPRFLGTDSEAPFTFTVASLPAGRHELHCAAVSDQGVVRRSPPVLVMVNDPLASAPRRTFLIATAARDAEGHVISLEEPALDRELQMRVWPGDGGVDQLGFDPPDNDFRNWAFDLGRYYNNLPATHPMFMFHVRLTHWLVIDNVTTLDDLSNEELGRRLLLRLSSSGPLGNTGPCIIPLAQARNKLVVGCYGRVGNLFKLFAARIPNLVTTGFIGQALEYRLFQIDMGRLGVQMPDAMPLMIANRIAQMAGVLGKSTTGLPDLSINGIAAAAPDPLRGRIATEVPYIFNDRTEAFPGMTWSDLPVWGMYTPPHMVEGLTNVYAPRTYTPFGTRPIVQLFRNGELVQCTNDPAEPWRVIFATMPTHLNLHIFVNQALPRNVASPGMRLNLMMTTGVFPIEVPVFDPNIDPFNPPPPPPLLFHFEAPRPGSLAVFNENSGEPMVNFVIEQAQLVGSYTRQYDSSSWTYRQIPIATGSFRMTANSINHPYQVEGSFNQDGLLRALVTRAGVPVGTLTREGSPETGQQWVFTDRLTGMVARDGIGWIE